MRKRNLLLFLLLSLTLAFFFNSCRKKQPMAPIPEPEVKISPNAHVIDSTTSQQLVSISSDSSTFTFSPEASAILALQTNDVMIVQRDQGYLRKVESVEQIESTIVVHTSDAALTDAIERGTFVDSGVLTPANVKSVSKLLKGVLLKASKLDPNAFVFQIDDVVIYDQDGNSNTITDQIRANGSLEVDVSRHFVVSIENWQLQRLEFTYSSQEDANLELSAEIEFLQISHKIEIACITFTTITIWIGYVPVFITPRLTIYVGIDGNAGASFSTGVTQHAEFTASIHYESGTWNNSENLTNNFSFNPPTLSSAVEAKGYAGTALELLIYGSLAPQATADAYLRLTANPATVPWWNLYGGLEAGLGVALRIVGHNLVDYSAPGLIAYERLLAHATTPALPTVTTSASSSITSNSAQLNGDVNPNGSPTNAWFEYGTSPTLSTYTSTTSQSVGADTVTVTVSQHVSVLSPNTTYYYRIAASNGAGTNRASILNFKTSSVTPGTWTRRSDFGGTGRENAVGFSIGDKIYVGTGWDGVMTWGGVANDFWMYDPVTDEWTQKADFGGGQRWYAVAFSVGGKGYVGLGWDQDWNYHTDIWEYDPQTDTWIQKANFPGGGLVDAVGFSIGNKGYIGCGSDSSGYRRDFWEYDPITNNWTQKADFDGGGRVGAVGFSIGGKGYIGLGTDGSHRRDFWEYDPQTDTWTQKADFGGTARNDAAAFSIGNKAYVGIGFDGSLCTDFWEYDPQTNIWTQKADFSGIGRGGAVGLSIIDRGYVATGNIYPSPYSRELWQYSP